MQNLPDIWQKVFATLITAGIIGMVGFLYRMSIDLNDISNRWRETNGKMELIGLSVRTNQKGLELLMVGSTGTEKDLSRLNEKITELEKRVEAINSRLYLSPKK